MEIHLFIIWSKALNKKKKILSDLANNFSILEVYNITWSKDFFADNLSRFYGQNLPKNSHKEKHCGNGTFTCIIVKDLNPLYSSRNTSKGVRVVNTNLFDAKKLYRSWTGGGHKIHATDNIEETRIQLMLLLKKRYDYYSNLKPSTISEKKYDYDLIGSRGWDSIKEVFEILNSTINYVILRNFESVEMQMNSLHPDIDLLTENLYNTISILGAKKTSKRKYRVQYSVLINDKNINFDLRSIGDNYYDVKWQKDILSSRIKENFYFRPSEVNYFYSLLYHAILHKSKLSSDYLRKLLDISKDKSIKIKNIISLNNSELLNNLKEFLDFNKYEFTYPNDYSVYWNYSIYSKKNKSYSLMHMLYRTYYEFKIIIGKTKKKYVGLLIHFIKCIILFLKSHAKIKQLIKNLDITSIEVYNFNKWHDGFVYYTGKTLSNKKVFIKVSTKHFFLENEMKFYDIFKNELPLPKQINFLFKNNVQILITEFLESRELCSDYILETPDILLKVLNILDIINKKGYIHRDIKLNNFLLVDNELRIIDFTFSTSFLDSNNIINLDASNIDDLTILKNLGGKFKPNIFEWNDFYSMVLIIDEVILKDMTDGLRATILNYQKLFIKNIDNNSYKIDTI